MDKNMTKLTVLEELESKLRKFRFQNLSKRHISQRNLIIVIFYPNFQIIPKILNITYCTCVIVV